ncbi:MAG: PIN domain-containing protein [Patescibacteria group bacterium]
MPKIIVDTSVIIDHLRGTSSDFETLENLRLDEEVDMLIPHMVITELFAGQAAQKRVVQTAYNELLKGTEIIGLTIDSAKKAGELMRCFPQVPDPFDFLIAAIALEHDAYIATHNQKHFKQLPKIKLFDFTQVL